MNKLILIAILLMSISCKSQSNIVDIIDMCNHDLNTSNGSVYLKDISNKMSPYIGTWKWTSGNREMTMTLLKQTKYHYNSGNTNYYEDRLVGYYTYKENGVTIIDTSGDNLMDDYGLNAGFSINCNGNIGTSSFEDIKKKKRYFVSLKILSPTQIKFTGKLGEGSYNRPNLAGQVIVYEGGTTFPLEMIFVKQ